MSTQSKNRGMIISLLLTAALILACGVTLTTPESPPAFDATKAALELQGTAMSLQLTQAALNSQPPVQPIGAPPSQAPEPAQVQPTPTQDFEARMKSAKILVYENTDELGVGMWVSEALDGMGLKYTQTGSYSGHFMEYLDSGTKWDLIIVDAESHDIITGEFWDVIYNRLSRDKAAMIAELWYLDTESNGPINKILGGCGVQYRKYYDLAESVYWWEPDNPTFNEPHTVLPLLHYSRYWRSYAGNKLLLSGGDATMLAGLSALPSSGEGVLASCFQGRVIIQTFMDHDFHESDIVPLWQNYIYNTLKSHFAVVP